MPDGHTLRRVTPNILSLARVPLALLVAWCVFDGAMAAAAALFALSVLTDVADGVLARRWQVTSASGGLLDHGSDATFVTIVLAAFAAQGQITWLLPPLILLAFTQYALDSGAQHGRQLRASRLGRWNGLAYFVLAGVLLGTELLALAWPTLVQAGAWLLVGATLLSMLDRLTASRRVPRSES